MPAPLVKALATRAEVSPAKVEGYWTWAKEQAARKFKKQGPGYWAYVNALTQRRLGLREANQRLGFREFLALDNDK